MELGVLIFLFAAARQMSSFEARCQQIDHLCQKMDAMLEKFNNMMDAFEARGFDPSSQSTQRHQSSAGDDATSQVNEMQEPGSAEKLLDDPEDDVESLPDHRDVPSGHLVADAQGKLR